MNIGSLVRLGVVVGSVAWPLLALGQSTPVVINELMYHPASENLREAFVELYNPGPNAVSLAHWRFRQGVAYAFPTNASVAPGGYLVVAADLAAFSAKYPSVSNVLAGWAGVLGKHLVLEDHTGQVVNDVHYADDGDWSVRRIGPVQYNHQGWEWHAEHNGLGASLELVNPALPNQCAQNWGPSLVVDGTPGQPNSLATNNAAPLILEVAHAPMIPQPAEVVTVSARLLDETPNGLTATVYYRDDGAASFTSAPMYDDGAHGDGVAADGIYGAQLPARPNATVVEFYLQAEDADGHSRIYPNVIPPTNSTRTANLLYQVDDGVYGGAQPVYRIIMREIERAELYALGRVCPDSESDALMNATFITTDGVLEGGTTIQLRYNVGVRNRGHGTRRSNPNNYHVSVPADRKWKNQGGINLNSQYAYSQVLGSAVFRRLGSPMADSRAVQVRVNSTNLMAVVGGANSFGSYAANEQYNDDFIQRSFPLDPHGNCYRGIRDATLCLMRGDADLIWHGTNYAIPAYTNVYFKENHLLENDWADLLELMRVLTVTNGVTPETYVADVRRVINVGEWMKYLAINTLIDNNETCLANGAPDDYGLYRGSNDTRFVALSYDMDDVMGRGLAASPPGRSIWRMTNMLVMHYFIKTPEFVPLYFGWLKTLAETAFAPAQMNPLLDQLLGDHVPVSNLNNFKAYNAAQIANVLAQVPQTLTLAHGLTVSNGYPWATGPTVTVYGQANAIDTRAVIVNGTTSSWTAWQGRWTNSSVTLHPGLNRLSVQSLNSNGVVFASTYLEIWYDNGGGPSVGNTVGANTTWSAAGGPYRITNSLTVASGVTLTIEPGTTVYLDASVNLTVANGGRLLAEGTVAAPICFTRVPGSSATWGGVTINGAAGSPETRISYAHFEFNGSTVLHSTGGTVWLDHLTFGTTDHQYVSLDSSSFMVSDCTFPTPTASFEPLHGSGGIKSGGRGIFVRNFFGAPTGYNDVIDFTGGNRPGSAIVQFINNVFAGSGDDLLDLDGTDAWIEGNIFMHPHKNGSPDSSSAVSGGNDSGNTSEITVIGNLFYDCDQAATAKQGNFYTLINNTIVRQTKQGGTDTDAAVINFADDGTTEGQGMYLEGNIIYEVEKLSRNRMAATVTFTNNLMPLPWTGPGGGNSSANPLFKYVPKLSETYFNSWQEAQVMRDWFSLLPGSPARGTGPNGSDKGGVVPLGASLSGEPVGTTHQTTATLTVGVNRTGSGIPAAGWPQGSGYTHYQWRLDGGAWSLETPIATPITLTGLANGLHYVEVAGRRDSAGYQNDPLLGADAVVTRSHTWNVDTGYVPPTAPPTIRLNEVLARNATTFTNLGATPDLLELFNYGSNPVDLSGLGLTDSATNQYKYVFPAGTTLAGGAYLVLFADSATGGAYAHTGFALKQSGDDLYLFDAPARGGALLDSVVFGVQAADLSIGRRTDGSWGPCKPTFGTNNLAQQTGDIHALKINEWLADAQFVSQNDFIELYNSNALPVALEGLYLSDAAGAPARHPIAALSFLGAKDYVAFIADGDANQGADHLNFKLSPDIGLILLSAPDLTPIDLINYGPQSTDVSQGRSPNGADTITTFAQPTPGGGNPGVQAGGSTISTLTIPLLPMTNVWHYNQTSNLNGVTWYATNYDDSDWSNGLALLAVEDCNCLPAPGIKTALILGRLTYYFRTTFVVNTNLSGFNLNLTMVLDDGAIVYLNGTRILTNGMNTGTPVYTTLSSRNVGNAVNEYFTVSSGALVQGTNVVAVEVHQSGSSSSDIVLGLALDASKTTTNYAPGAVVPVVLNEILAANQSVTNLNGATADYLELYNPSTNTVDLSATSLTDDLVFPRKWSFPTGSILEPGAYRVVYCDGSQAASTTNTGFGLNADGGAVFFFNSAANGGGLIDAARYGLQIPDYALGRVPNGSGNWTLTLPTAGDLNEAAALASVASLRVNEWMADPASGSDWFELYNTANQPVALGGLFLTDNLTDRTQSPIPPLSFIGTGVNAFLKFVADGNAGAGADHVNFSLKKSGEAIGLFSPSGVMLDGVAFGPQITGVSQGRFPDGSAGWVSFAATPSPAESNYLPLTNAVINEVLTHTDPPLEDAIELFNPTGTPADLSGWYLSNTKDNLKKFRIPDGTVLPANSFAVFYEDQFNSTNGVPFNFNSAQGDRAILSQADALGNLTGYRQEMKFGAAENGVSFGRYPTSVGVDFTALSRRTFGVDDPPSLTDFRTGAGLPNALPKVGPVVVTEIMYHPFPNPVENPDEEFVELQNISTNTVALFDPAYPTNTCWLRDAVSFTFPTNLSLAPGEHLLVVGFDPANVVALAAFRAAYGISNNVIILGPWSGRLDNAGDSVELVKPDAVQLPPHPEAGYVPSVLVDKVAYGDTAPWPVAADGTGASLHRLLVGAYGNDPANWEANLPTPGRATSHVTNTLPMLSELANQTVMEGTLVSFVATATDTDQPLQVLSFTLDPGAPVSAAIHPNTGVFTWTPTEAQGPGVYTVTIRVTDDGFPTLSAARSFTITVQETNAAPVLAAIGDRTIGEGSWLAFTAAATEADLPAQTLVFSLEPGAPEGATLTPNGDFSWTPSEAQGPGTYTVTVRVIDNGVPPLSDTETFTITVNEVNTAPVLALLSNRSATVSNLVTFTATATDDDLPAQTLWFTLDPGAPAGASLSTAGEFAWTPIAAQANTTNFITLRVSDNGLPSLSSTRTFTVVVADVNHPPVLAPLADQTAYEGILLTFTNAATDPNGSAQTLTYTLDDGAPAGASVNPTNGVFTWTPTSADVGTTNVLTIRVTDNGTPSLSDTQSFTVVVLAASEALPAQDQAAGTTEEAPAELTLGPATFYGSNLVYTVISGPRHGSLGGEGNIRTYSPEANFNGTDSFTFTVSDGAVTTSPATVTITVGSDNDVAPYLFGPPTFVGAGAQPVAVASADINKDVKADLLVANAGAGTVTLLLGDGAGGFNWLDDLAVGGSPAAIAMADFNKDTLVDVAVAKGTEGTVEVWWGGGDGAFGLPTTLTVGRQPSALVVGDFNKDARPDLAVANAAEGTVSVVLGNSLTVFSPPVAWPVGSNPVAVALGDFNKDGKADLAMATAGDNRVGVLLGTGNGAFSNLQVYPAGFHPVALAAADLNGDGRTDLAAANWDSGDLSVFLAGPLGILSNAVHYPLGALPTALVAADFNKDGKVDLAVADAADNSVKVLLGSGGGAFVNYYFDAGVYYPVGLHPVGLVTNDFFKDGNADLAVVQQGSDDVAVLLNNHTPRAYKQRLEVYEDQPLALTLTGTAGPLTFTVTGGPTNGTLTGTPPNLVYRPATNTFGKDYLDFKVDDGATTSAVARVSITVIPVNDQPSFAIATNVLAVNEDSGTFKYTNFVASFSKGPANEVRQTIKYELTVEQFTGHGEELFARRPAISTAGLLSFAPAKNAYGRAVVTARLKDNGGTAYGGRDTSDPRVFTLYVTNVNDTPTLSLTAARTILEDRWTNFVFTVGDPETPADQLNLTVTSTNQTLLPDSQIVVTPNGNQRTVTVTPLPDAFGRSLLTFTVSDGTNSFSRSATLTVNAVNDAPSFTLATNRVYARSNAGMVTNNVIATVSKGPANEASQTLTYTLGPLTDPALFVVAPALKSDGRLIFKPRNGLTGSVTLSVTLKDSGGILNGGVNTVGPVPLTITITP